MHKKLHARGCKYNLILIRDYIPRHCTLTEVTPKVQDQIMFQANRGSIWGVLFNLPLNSILLTPNIFVFISSHNRFFIATSLLLIFLTNTPWRASYIPLKLGRDLESLQHRRYINILSMLYKIQHGIIDISPDFVQLNDQRTRGSKRLPQLPATNDGYK